MRYPVPAGVVCGIVAAIVPFPVELRVPIVVAELNEPEASDNCAVKTLPALKVPLVVYPTETAAFGAEGLNRKGEPVTDEVVIVALPTDMMTSLLVAVTPLISDWHTT